MVNSTLKFMLNIRLIVFSPDWEFILVCKWYVVAVLIYLTDGNFHEASATYTYHTQVHSYYM